MSKKHKVKNSAESVIRFRFWVRFEHAAVIALFAALLVTGLPQKWPDLDLSRSTVELFGGIYSTRFFHRLAGILFGLLVVVHLGRVIYGVLSRRYPPTMMVTRQDFHDTVDSLRYYLGKLPAPPRFGRYSYHQKFEYWGMIFGSLIMVLTGFVLYFPILTSRILPAEVIPACKVMHSQEAMLALLIVIIWHMYNAHLSPEVFPADLSIFTGRISKERLESEHPLESEELGGEEVADATPARPE